MSEYQKKDFGPPNPGYGAAWWNREATGGQPQFKGSMTLDRDYRQGEEVKFGCWIKKTKTGNDYISLSISRPARQENSAFSPAPDREVRPSYGPRNKVEEDDLPF